MSQKQICISREGIVFVILREHVYMYEYICAISNGVRDGAMSLYTLNSADEQGAGLSHEWQSTLMLCTI
jgi:hypothetical protein